MGPGLHSQAGLGGSRREAQSKRGMQCQGNGELETKIILQTKIWGIWSKIKRNQWLSGVQKQQL